LACWGGIILFVIACVCQVCESGKAHKPPEPCTPQQLEEKIARAKIRAQAKEAETQAKEAETQAKEAEIVKRRKNIFRDLAKMDEAIQLSILSDCDELFTSACSIIKVKFGIELDYEDIKCDYNRSIARLLEIQQQFAEYSHLSDCLRKIADKFEAGMSCFVPSHVTLPTLVKGESIPGNWRPGDPLKLSSSNYRTKKEVMTMLLQSLKNGCGYQKDDYRRQIAGFVEMGHAMGEVNEIRGLIEMGQRQRQRQRRKSKDNPN
jgi:hypothetical protein